MNRRVVIVFACGISVAYNHRPSAASNKDADPSDSLAKLLLAYSPGATTHQSSHVPVQSAATQPTLMNRRQIGTGLLGLATAGLASPAFAGLKESYQVAYRDYGASINRARDYWQYQLPKLIENGNWEQIQKDMALPNDGSKESKKGGMMYQYRRSMSNYIRSQEKQYSPVALEGGELIDELRESCEEMMVAGIGKVEEPGFLFFKSTKNLDPASRKTMALAAQKRGKTALKKYIDLSNARPLIVPIEQMDDVSSRPVATQTDSGDQ